MKRIGGIYSYEIFFIPQHSVTGGRLIKKLHPSHATHLSIIFYDAKE